LLSLSIPVRINSVFVGATSALIVYMPRMVVVLMDVADTLACVAIIPITVQIRRFVPLITRLLIIKNVSCFGVHP
jgi:hypothetical protein